MINASIESLCLGQIKPRVRQEIRGREYFQFHSGQIRRQIGYGHSRVERRARRLADRMQTKFGALRLPAGALAAGMLARHFGVKSGGKMA